MTNGPQAFVTGFPIAHSLSPEIHRYWLKHYQLTGNYNAIATPPNDFTSFLAKVRREGFCGGNVTLPLKELAFLNAEHCDTTATTIGAANTLWFEGKTLCASNSDAYGFTANLDDFVPGWSGDTALVLGAGGAARSIVYALQVRGFKRIILCNRSIERAQKLAAALKLHVEVRSWEERQAFVPVADLIVNTTPLGMAETGPGSLNAPIDLRSAQPSVIITDIVYTPLLTPLLAHAQRLSLKTVDGLGMLLHQAVPGFERWFGVKPTVSPQLRQLLIQTLQGD